MKILGRHLNVCSPQRMPQAIKKYLDENTISGFAPAFQIFIGDPTKHDNKNIYNILKKENIILINKMLKQANAFVAVHASYLTQMTHFPIKNKIAMSVLFNEIISAFALGVKFVVVHCGSKKRAGEVIKKQQAIENISANYVGVITRFVKQIIDKWFAHGYRTTLSETMTAKKITPPKLLLEVSAGAGGEIGKKVKDFSRIYPLIIKGINELSEEERRIATQMVGFCIDTCHIFASGIDIRKEEHARKYFEEFSKVVDNKIEFIHFNDSGSNLGENKDIHDTIGCGKITTGKDGSFAGLSWICKFAESHSIPIVLETSERECETLAETPALVNKEEKIGIRELKLVAKLFTGADIKADYECL